MKIIFKKEKNLKNNSKKKEKEKLNVGRNNLNGKLINISISTKKKHIVYHCVTENFKKLGAMNLNIKWNYEKNTQKMEFVKTKINAYLLM